MATIYPDKIYRFSVESSIEPKPEKILSKCEKMKYPLDIEFLIKEQSIEICKEEMDYAISGYIERRERGWIIGVNKYHSKQRKRVTLAHEFAHYILHREIIGGKHEDMALFRNNEINPMETEANNLASEILIPQKKFKDYVDNGVKKYPTLQKNLTYPSSPFVIKHTSWVILIASNSSQYLFGMIL